MSEMQQIDVKIGDKVVFLYFNGFKNGHSEVSGPVVHIISPNVIPSEDDVKKYFDLTPSDEDPAAPMYSKAHRAINAERIVIETSANKYKVIPNSVELHGTLTKLST